jgi:hypothetical protein
MSREMLLLTDTIWRELQGGYRVPYDASKVLARMERGESVWEELWKELHHQGDVGVASYAAIPQIVRISEVRRDGNWNLYALAATIEIERHRKNNPPLPDWLVPSYKTAWEGIVKLALSDLAGKPDDAFFQQLSCPIFLLIFGVPAIVAIFLKWRIV